MSTIKLTRLGTKEVQIVFDLTELKAARLKYLQLGGEIEDRDNYSNLAHSHSKLGIFLQSIFGSNLWKLVEDMIYEDVK